MLKTTTSTPARRGVLTLGLFIGLIAAEACAQEELSIPAAQKESYAIGVDLARNIRRRGVQVDPEALVKGIRDVLANQKLQMTDDEIIATLRAFQVALKQKEFASRKGIAVGSQQDEMGEVTTFLAQNKVKEGVVTLPDGLQYRILKAGDGPKPAETDTVECHFRGTYIDGTEFANSRPSGQPATLKMAEMAPGLKEALQLMSVGSKWEVVIPPQLNPEKNPARLRTQPSKVVIYELELLAIK
jgi:FKBP-type peptidyl-prolyl cis-trans isomerase FklB